MSLYTAGFTAQTLGYTVPRAGPHLGRGPGVPARAPPACHAGGVT
ncbi:hypothetical protein [Streptomyces sp. NPDC048551]